MFFFLSKILGFFAAPSNILVSLGLIGVLLLPTRFARLGKWLLAVSMILIALIGLSPLGNILILPLEQRFPPWDEKRGAPDGIIVLGGSIGPELSIERDEISLNESAERLTVMATLAKKYPLARIIFSGGNNGLLVRAGTEAELAVELLQSFGIDAKRLAAENQSRNTVENALFSVRIANPKAGERWLLVTSAYHMPRAVGVFRAAGFPVEAFPVDFRTRGWVDMIVPIDSIGNGVRRTDTAIREWVGLVMYRVTGRSSALFPAP